MSKRILIYNNVFDISGQSLTVVSASILKTLNDVTVCRAAILIHRFMQSKSGSAPPENEPVASDRRTAYL